MANTLITAPPARAFSDDPIWVRLQTDVEISAGAAVELTFTGGPSEGDTITIAWAGNALEFEFTATAIEAATDLPLIGGGEALATYVNRVAEKLAQNEVLHDYFRVVRSSSGGEKIRLAQRVVEVVDITFTDSAANLTATVTDVTAVTAQDALRALVQVWTDTGSIATDQLLLSVHAPYILSTGIAELDIHAAFALLRPHLPTEVTINPLVFISLLSGAATSSQQKYYLRYADKFGSPAAAGDLVRSASYFALLGSRAGDSNAVATAALRHRYTTRAGSTLVKPSTYQQPDWLYWVCPAGVTQVYIDTTLYWDNDTESNYKPFGTTGIAVTEGNMYWFGVGFQQLKLGNATVPSGASYITGYRAVVTRSDGTPMIGDHGVSYQLFRSPDWEVVYLLFDNGVGGCESVAFRGKNEEAFESNGETFPVPRTRLWSTIDGDLQAFNANGRRLWEVNTGWLSDAAYLDHLRQLALSQAWYIDTVNRKFRRVIVTPGKMTVRNGDETLYSQSFTIRAAWLDSSANV